MYKLVQGQHISLTQQIQQFTDTLQQFILSMGEDAATNLISNSVFYVSIGINDYIHYYLLNESNVDNLYLPWHFNHFLASSLQQEIRVKTVLRFNFSVKKIMIFIHFIRTNALFWCHVRVSNMQDFFDETCLTQC